MRTPLQQFRLAQLITGDKVLLPQPHAELVDGSGTNDKTGTTPPPLPELFGSIQQTRCKSSRSGEVQAALWQLSESADHPGPGRVLKVSSGTLELYAVSSSLIFRKIRPGNPAILDTGILQPGLKLSCKTGECIQLRTNDAAILVAITTRALIEITDIPLNLVRSSPSSPFATLTPPSGQSKEERSSKPYRRLRFK
jgi:hypothetical protein